MRSVLCIAALLVGVLLLPPRASAQGASPPSGPALSEEAALVRAQQLLVRGLTRAYVEDHEEALALYTEALKLAPQEAALLAAAARSYEIMNDATNARFYAEQAVQAAPGNQVYAEELARLLLRQGATEDALAAYEALIGRFPDALEARFELARLQQMTGAYDDARATYEALLDRTAEREAVYTHLLQLYARQGDDEGLERILRRLMEVNPVSAEYPRMLGDVLRQRGAYAEAAQAFEEALRLAPGDMATTLVLSDVYEALGEEDRAARLIDEALDTEGATAEDLVARATPLYARSELDASAADVAARLLAEALRIAPDQKDALLMLGELRYRDEAYDEAADLLYRAAQANPRELQVWTQAAAAYLQSGAPLQGAEVAEEALLLFPGQFPLLRIAAYGLMDGYRSEAALIRFEEALEALRETAPGSTTEASDLVASMAMLHSRKQRTLQADSLYQEAITLDPENAVALNNYAYSLAGRQLRLDDALEMAERAVDLGPGTASFYDTLGWVHYQRGDLDAAEQWIRQALDTGEASALVHEHMGDVKAQQGDLNAARTYWQQALDLSPDNDALRNKLDDASE